eukprot:365381-Chlamydomonas_euryale.AAC.31
MCRKRCVRASAALCLPAPPHAISVSYHPTPRNFCFASPHPTQFLFRITKHHHPSPLTQPSPGVLQIRGLVQALRLHLHHNQPAPPTATHPVPQLRSESDELRARLERRDAAAAQSAAELRGARADAEAAIKAAEDRCGRHVVWEL